MKKKKMRVLLGIVSFVMAAFILASCGSEEKTGKNGLAKEINIYVWSEYLPDELYEGFEKKYGIKVNYTYFTSTDEMVAKLMSGGGDEFDLVQPSLPQLKGLRENKYIQKLDFDNIPNFKYINKSFTNYFDEEDSDYVVPYMSGTTVVAYNKKTCPIEIKSFDDLLDPALEGQIVSITSSQTMIAMVMAHLGLDPNSKEEKDVKQATEWLKKLKPNIKVFDGDAPRKSLLNGECSVAIIYGGDLAIAMNEQPDTFEVADFKVDDFRYGIGETTLAVPTGAAHKKEAEMFINYIHEPKVMAMILDKYPYISTNDAAKELASDEYKALSVYDISQEKLDNAYSLEDLGDAAALYDQYWSEFMSQ